jgi:hypothetical protein
MSAISGTLPVSGNSKNCVPSMVLLLVRCTYAVPGSIAISLGRGTRRCCFSLVAVLKAMRAAPTSFASS